MVGKSILTNSLSSCNFSSSVFCTDMNDKNHGIFVAESVCQRNHATKVAAPGFESPTELSTMPLIGFVIMHLRSHSFGVMPSGFIGILPMRGSRVTVFATKPQPRNDSPSAFHGAWYQYPSPKNPRAPDAFIIGGNCNPRSSTMKHLSFFICSYLIGNVLALVIRGMPKMCNFSAILQRWKRNLFAYAMHMHRISRKEVLRCCLEKRATPYSLFLTYPFPCRAEPMLLYLEQA